MFSIYPQVWLKFGLVRVKFIQVWFSYKPNPVTLTEPGALGLPRTCRLHSPQRFRGLFEFSRGLKLGLVLTENVQPAVCIAARYSLGENFSKFIK